jgi:hypothetical protein
METKIPSGNEKSKSLLKIKAQGQNSAKDFDFSFLLGIFVSI